MSLAALLAVVIGASPSGASVPASDVWSKLAIAVREHRNAVYNAVMDNEAAAALRTAALAPTTSAACKDAYLAPGVRVFVSDLYLFGLGNHGDGFGENCRFVERNIVRGAAVRGVSTFNDAWLQFGSMRPPTPEPFFDGHAAYSVPTIRLSGAAIVRRLDDTEVIELHCRDQRYGVLLFAGNARLSLVRAAAVTLMTGYDAGDFYPGPRGPRARNLLLALPQFAVATTVETRLAATAGRKVTFSQTAVVRLGEFGVGKSWDWPPLPHFGFIGPSYHPPLALSFNHPFYFAIVYWSAHALLFIGYVAHPTLNAE
ncbi:MAG TPA: hypothetical protein VMV82_04790 [Candidatus Dormibacteraeota bacterium]|nr:hypothetical protein [Candidatus Dormibacteraeota bacterium]